jgi:dTDP-4-dehydrorhamnose 3,5-epimerase
MLFYKAKLQDAFIVEPEKIIDDRGFFARVWCKKEISSKGMNPKIVQANIGYNKKKGTLRGLHFQTKPYQEVKIIKCTRGAIFDVIVDLRKKSPTYMQWEGFELSENNRKMVYVPKGFAQGYLTLADDTEIFYLTSEFYSPEHARGIRFNDYAFKIAWPLKINVISNNDKDWPDYVP